jgi:crotonobetainyl-CoA:carnitine CoA-transferase CaiB-like acyl-CoA transferase
MADPQVRHIGAFTSMPGAGGADITLVNHPVRYNGKPPKIRMAPQPLGAQTASILEEIGYGPHDVAALEERGVIRTGGAMEPEAGSGETAL